MRVNPKDVVQDVEVRIEGGRMVLSGRLQLSLPLPGERVPDQLEHDVEQAGQAINRELFRCLVERADLEEVLRVREGN